MRTVPFFLIFTFISLNIFGQKVQDLKFYNVKDEIAKGNIIIIGQGFDNSSFGRLPLYIKDSKRK